MRNAGSLVAHRSKKSEWGTEGVQCALSNIDKLYCQIVDPKDPSCPS
jgi:hypothetical protein